MPKIAWVLIYTLMEPAYADDCTVQQNLDPSELVKARSKFSFFADESYRTEQVGMIFLCLDNHYRKDAINDSKFRTMIHQLPEIQKTSSLRMTDSISNKAPEQNTTTQKQNDLNLPVLPGYDLLKAP